jgi:hypothetical protein
MALLRSNFAVRGFRVGDVAGDNTNIPLIRLAHELA